MRLISTIIALVFSFLVALPVYAAGEGDVAPFVEKAANLLRTQGLEKAASAFNNPKGDWVKGELYIFVFDMKGNYLASGANPKLVGTNAMETKDAEGKPVVAELIRVASSPAGKGTVDYVWLNRSTNKVEKKTSYVERVGDLIVGSGYYH